MKIAHNIKLRVFCREGDDENKILGALHKLVEADFKKIDFKAENAELFEDKKMKIFTIILKKNKNMRRFIENIFRGFNEEQKNLLRRQIESRLDSDLHFFIRLDKPKLLDGEFWVTDSGNCFHIDICIAAYPHKREVAREIVEMMLDS